MVMQKNIELNSISLPRGLRTLGWFTACFRDERPNFTPYGGSGGSRSLSPKELAQKEYRKFKELARSYRDYTLQTDKVFAMAENCLFLHYYSEAKDHFLRSIKLKGLNGEKLERAYKGLCTSTQKCMEYETAKGNSAKAQELNKEFERVLAEMKRIFPGSEWGSEQNSITLRMQQKADSNKILNEAVGALLKGDLKSAGEKFSSVEGWKVLSAEEIDKSGIIDHPIAYEIRKKLESMHLVWNISEMLRYYPQHLVVSHKDEHAVYFSNNGVLYKLLIPRAQSVQIYTVGNMIRESKGINKHVVSETSGTNKPVSREYHIVLLDAEKEMLSGSVGSARKMFCDVEGVKILTVKDMANIDLSRYPITKETSLKLIKLGLKVSEIFSSYEICFIISKGNADIIYFFKGETLFKLKLYKGDVHKHGIVDVVSIGKKNANMPSEGIVTEELKSKKISLVEAEASLVDEYKKWLMSDQKVDFLHRAMNVFASVEAVEIKSFEDWSRLTGSLRGRRFDFYDWSREAEGTLKELAIETKWGVEEFNKRLLPENKVYSKLLLGVQLKNGDQVCYLRVTKFGKDEVVQKFYRAEIDPKKNAVTSFFEIRGEKSIESKPTKISYYSEDVQADKLKAAERSLLTAMDWRWNDYLEPEVYEELCKPFEAAGVRFWPVDVVSDFYYMRLREFDWQCDARSYACSAGFDLDKSGYHLQGNDVMCWFYFASQIDDNFYMYFKKKDRLFKAKVDRENEKVLSFTEIKKA
jgi:hypothetical protein